MLADSAVRKKAFAAALSMLKANIRDAEAAGKSRGSSIRFAEHGRLPVR
jgi:hypothetical protein